MDIQRKNSKKRRAMLELLCADKSHPTAESIFNRLKPDFPELSLGTVYRNLAVLAENGDITSVGTVGGQERYDANTAPHAHFICRCCHRVIDLELPDMVSSLYSQINRELGCESESYSLSVNGLCDRCRSK